MHRIVLRTATVVLFNLFFLSATCQGGEMAQTLAFSDLDRMDGEGVLQDGQPVRITGFLYTTPDSRTILSPEPNLKSCCVGSSTKRSRQILLDGGGTAFEQSDRAVTVEGVLEKRAEGDFPYRLNGARLVNGDRAGTPALIAGALFLLISGTTGYLALTRCMKP